MITRCRMRAALSQYRRTGHKRYLYEAFMWRKRLSCDTYKANVLDPRRRESDLILEMAHSFLRWMNTPLDRDWETILR